MPERVTIPLYCAIWRAPLGPTDCSVHVAGQTGEGKSAYVALIQQHYGPELDDRKLPGSWLSTGNSLEVLAFAAKDALLVVDDYAPQGSRVDDQRLQKEAARLFGPRAIKRAEVGFGRMGPSGRRSPPRPGCLDRRGCPGWPLCASPHVHRRDPGGLDELEPSDRVSEGCQ